MRQNLPKVSTHYNAILYGCERETRGGGRGRWRVVCFVYAYGDISQRTDECKNATTNTEKQDLYLRVSAIFTTHTQLVPGLGFSVHGLNCSEKPLRKFWLDVWSGSSNACGMLGVSQRCSSAEHQLHPPVRFSEQFPDSVSPLRPHRKVLCRVCLRVRGKRHFEKATGQLVSVRNFIDKDGD